MLLCVVWKLVSMFACALLVGGLVGNQSYRMDDRVDLDNISCFMTICSGSETDIFYWHCCPLKDI